MGVSVLEIRRRVIIGKKPEYNPVSVSGVIQSNGKWAVSQSDESLTIRIVSGSEIEILAGSRYSAISFLTDNSGITDGAVAHFAGGSSYNFISSGNHVFYTAPAGTKYLVVSKKASNAETGVLPEYLAINGISVSLS